VEATLREQVRRRADARCEYCRLPEVCSYLPFQLEHVISEKHNGPTNLENLAWACTYCNAFKGPNIAGWLEERDEIIRLFHPRKDSWQDHFEWSGAYVLPKTDIGRVTMPFSA
jgi:hypothetical protein